MRVLIAIGTRWFRTNSTSQTIKMVSWTPRSNRLTMSPALLVSQLTSLRQRVSREDDTSTMESPEKPLRSKSAPHRNLLREMRGARRAIMSKGGIRWKIARLVTRNSLLVQLYFPRIRRSLIFSKPHKRNPSLLSTSTLVL